jgi:hypothetical protein
LEQYGIGQLQQFAIAVRAICRVRNGLSSKAPAVDVEIASRNASAICTGKNGLAVFVARIHWWWARVALDWRFLEAFLWQCVHTHWSNCGRPIILQRNIEQGLRFQTFRSRRSFFGWSQDASPIASSQFTTSVPFSMG